MTDPSTRQRAAEQALLWWTQLRQAGVSADAEQRFFAWLQASPVHVEEYLRVATVAPRIPPAPITAEDPFAEHQADDPPKVMRFDRAWVRPVVGAAVCILLLVVLWHQLAPRRGLPVPALAERVLSTRHGELRSWVLSDGSVAELGPDSEAHERYSPNERLIQLRAGRADFHVAKGDRRRFRVLALGGSVVATGTRFEVNLDDQHEVVTLAEGRIVVYANPVEGEHAMQPEARAAQQLVPGEQVLMAAGWVSPPTRVDLRSVEAWKRGQIEAENLPLADVVREFNRYAERPIRIEGRELAATRLSGVFNVRDEASLLAFLHAGLGVEGVSDTHGLLLRSRGAITGSPNTEVE